MNIPWTRTGRFPLHILIAATFILFTTVVGGVLGWFNYHQNTRVILAASDRVFEQISRELLLDFQNTYQPVVSTVNILALKERLCQASTLEERLALLPIFREALMTQPHVSAIQVGYGSGDYFIVRPLEEAYMRRRFDAPAAAALVADHIARNEDGEHIQVRLYFDADLNRLAGLAMGPTTYDPRTRPWYTITVGNEREVSTDPYLYYFLGKIGITVGRQSPDGRAVVASDVTLEHLSQTLARHRISPSAEAVLFDADGRALAYRNVERLILKTEDESLQMARVSDLGSPVLSALANRLQPAETTLSFNFRDREWRGAVRRVKVTEDIVFYLAITAPKEELVADAAWIRRQSVRVTAIILLAALPLALLLADRIARPLRRLTSGTDRIRRFDFSATMTKRSRIREIDALAKSTDAMKTTIQNFLDLVSSVASETHFDALLQRITDDSMQMSRADAAALYLVNEAGTALEPACLRVAGGSVAADVSPLPPAPLCENTAGGPLADSIRTGTTITSRFPGGNAATSNLARAFSSLLPEAQQVTLVAIPLRARDGHVSGTLALAFDTSPGRRNGSVEQARVAFIEAFSSFAVLSLESQRLLKAQKALLDAFIKLMAGTIDAKSPYTGGHCQRVPVLTRMIAEAACASGSHPFQEFNLDPEGWEALHIASYLHDYGKVTTPEYVVDKATKLETVHNRLHEIRTRFEVLKRDATIRYWENLAGGGDERDLRENLERDHRRLEEEFAFVAKCNEGREFISTEQVEQLHRIGAQTWVRTFDKDLGLSVQEAKRTADAATHCTPVAERLLQDAPEHLIDGADQRDIDADNPWGFQLDPPGHAYNLGELYNLSIDRGTLTPEERYKINDHIVQTIIMLSSLPWPQHLRSVPDIAGGHHERPDGSGYPRRLTKEQLPLEARIMAVADIFEALTAPDRPYRKPKCLSEALDIMRSMAQRNHIDPDVFQLFLSSGVCAGYAQKYLRPDQLDLSDRDIPAVWI